MNDILHYKKISIEITHEIIFPIKNRTCLNTSRWDFLEIPLISLRIHSWHKKESHATWWTCSTLILRLRKYILLWLSIWWAQNQPNNPPAFNIIWKMMKIKKIIFIMFAELILWIRTSESLEAEAIWWKLADKTGQSKFRYWNLRKIYRKK